MTLSAIDAEIAALLHRPPRRTLGLRLSVQVLRPFMHADRVVQPDEVIMLSVAAALAADKLGLVRLLSE
jgi:hypothetical protein